MNEISRCCQVLAVKHGASLEEVKKTYHDLAQVWHPDRFAHNERLRLKAEEQLKEINIAYQYLIANAFADGILIEPPEPALIAPPATEAQPAPDPPPSPTPARPEPSSDWPEEEQLMPEEAAPRNLFWPLVAGVVILAGCGILLYSKIHGRAQNTPSTRADDIAVPSPSPSSNNATPATEHAAAPTVPPAPATPAGGSFPYSTDVFAAMTASNAVDRLQTTQLLTPPFGIRAKVTLTKLDELRLYYALGRVIFNWSERTKELRIRNPRNSTLTPVREQGFLLPAQSHDILWQIGTNQMSISVDGQERFRTDGDFAGVKGFPAISPYRDSVVIESFALETPRPLEDPPAPARDHGPIPGDLLAEMVPEKNVRVTSEPDGLALLAANDSGNRLMSAQRFEPPFVIRTRAKTDALNLRLYCGTGEVIFNWEKNAQELRVHDPLNGRQSPVPGKGLLSPNEWHALIWEIQNTGMKLFVDGQLRFQNSTDYRTLKARVGIGPSISKVTVDYFLVEKK